MRALLFATALIAGCSSPTPRSAEPAAAEPVWEEPALPQTPARVEAKSASLYEEQLELTLDVRAPSGVHLLHFEEKRSAVEAFRDAAGGDLSAGANLDNRSVLTRGPGRCKVVLASGGPPQGEGRVEAKGVLVFQASREKAEVARAVDQSLAKGSTLSAGDLELRLAWRTTSRYDVPLSAKQKVCFEWSGPYWLIRKIAFKDASGARVGSKLVKAKLAGPGGVSEQELLLGSDAERLTVEVHYWPAPETLEIPFEVDAELTR